MDLNYMKVVLIGLSNTLFNIFSKDDFLFKFITAIFMFFAGIHVYIAAVLVLAIIDVITGIIASIKKGEPFKSKILKKGLLEKTGLYLLLMIVVFTLDTLLKSVLNYEPYYIVYVFTLLVSFYETTSILENVVTIYPELKFLNRFKKLFEKVIDKQIENVEESINNADMVEKAEA